MTGFTISSGLTLVLGSGGRASATIEGGGLAVLQSGASTTAGLAFDSGATFKIDEGGVLSGLFNTAGVTLYIGELGSRNVFGGGTQSGAIVSRAN